SRNLNSLSGVFSCPKTELRQHANPKNKNNDHLNTTGSPLKIESSAILLLDLALTLTGLLFLKDVTRTK
ncbi:MAG: hypothetical protein ACPHO8_17935, partial [Mariniblastus sp.]